MQTAIEINDKRRRIVICFSPGDPLGLIYPALLLDGRAGGAKACCSY
jgi:hypothetical protein